MKIVLISCSGPKLDVSAQAQDIYTSDLFKKSRAYAEAKGDRWAILSAKLGLVLPDEMVEPYDLTLSKVTPQFRKQWSQRVLDSIIALEGFSEMEVLAGKHYLGWMDQSPLPVRLPLKGLGIGQRLKFLKGAVQVDQSEQDFCLVG